MGTTEFYQYAKFDLSYTSLHTLNTYNSIAWRALGGIAIPYANSASLPVDKMYYSGGANSLRGWQIRTVGPGYYSGDTLQSMYNRLAGMRLEFNMEYRFKFFWRLEGALFLDAGNIWSVQNEDSRKGAVFNLRDFPKQVAIDWGAGLRLNFTVLVIRLDYGIKLHDPAIAGKYFVSPRSWLSRGYNSVFLALNYPF
jgi:outer membrane protein assembly factor BamA